MICIVPICIVSRHRRPDKITVFCYREALHSDRASAYLRSTASGFESAYSDVEISFIEARAENATRFLCRQYRANYRRRSSRQKLLAAVTPGRNMVERQTGIRVSKPTPSPSTPGARIRAHRAFLRAAVRWTHAQTTHARCSQTAQVNGETWSEARELMRI